MSALLLVLLLSACEEGSAAPFVPGFDRFARHTQEADGGDVLLSELSCTECHTDQTASLAPKGGPDLSGAGLRISGEWLQEFLLNPAKVKPGTTMPAMLDGLSSAEQGRAAASLVALLATQQQDFPELRSTASAPVAVEFWNKGDADRGRTLYHTVGCVACHEPDPDYDVDAPPPSSLETLLEQLDEDELRELGLTDAARPVMSVPLPKLSAKYPRRSLAHFLLNPSLIRPSGRMPSLKLNPAEAADMAAWLLRDPSRNLNVSFSDRSPDSSTEVSDDLAKQVAEGKRLFVELRCSSCHTAEGVTERKTATPLRKLDADARNGCLNQPNETLPRFALDDVQRTALHQALNESRAGRLPVERPGQLVEFRMQQLNCFACHERDGRGGVGPKRRPYFEIAGHVDLGDEGRIPPPLTGVGRKLKGTWLKKVLGGTGDVRPHMLARMPIFPDTVADTLPSAFARADDLTPRSEDAVFGESKSLAAAGRELLDTGCVQCHPIRGEQLPGVVGIDLEGVAVRVEPQWFHDFLQNPAALKNRTRMPTFFPNGKSASRELLDGDVEKQIAAMWAYIKDVANQPLPEKIEQGKVHDFELVPTDRPIVLRTFLRDAGPHGIAVGFPQKIHLAFDAEQVRVAEFWKGKFLDAHGTWFDRFTPLAAPLGTDIVKLPDGVPFAFARGSEAWPELNGAEAGYQSHGYQLDPSGTPEFLYRFLGIDISDRIAPNGGSEFVRRITLRSKADKNDVQKLWFRVLTGRSLQRLPNGGVQNETGLTATVAPVLAGQAILIADAGASASGRVREWRLPIEFSRDGAAMEAVIEVRYAW